MTSLGVHSAALLEKLWRSSAEFVGESGTPYGSKVWNERGGSSASAVSFCRSWAEKADPVALRLETVVTRPDPRDWLDPVEALAQIKVAQAGEVFPLSEPQMGVLMATEMARDTEWAYGFYAVFECDEMLDEQMLRHRYTSLLNAHAALTVQVIDTPEGPKQRTRSSAALIANGFRFHTTSGWASREDLVRRFGRVEFDVRNDPLFAWDLVVAEDGRSALVHSEHHLVHDGRSFERLLEELQVLEDGGVPEQESRSLRHTQDARATARDSGPSPVPTTERWEGFATGYQLVGRRPPATGQAPYLRLPISKIIRSKIADYAATNGVSEFELWYAVFAKAALEVLGTDRVVSATSVAGRSASDYDSVGMYVQMSYLRLSSKSDTEAGLLGLARSVRSRRSIPLDQLQRMAQAAGRTERSTTAVAAVSFNSHAQQRRSVGLGGQRTRLTMGVHIGGAKFPLNGILIQHSDTQDAELLVEGQSSVVSTEDLWALWSMMGRTWRRLLGLDDLSSATPAGPTRLESRIRDFANEYGDRVALESDAVQVTYEQLERFAQRARSTFYPGDHVVIAADASPAHYAVAHAVMAAGGWYVPLDPQKGDDYIRQVTDSLKPSFEVDDPQALLEAGLQGRELGLERRQTQRASEADSAGGGYIIYTSGTTKEPRGVRVSKSQLSLHCPESALVRGITSGQRVSQICSPGFDASCYEVWPTLFSGATVRFIPPALRYDVRAVHEYVQRQGIDHLFLPTPLGELFLGLARDARLASVSVGGDRLHDKDSGAAFPVINAYGPTETVIACSLRRMEAGEKIDGTIAHCLSVHTEAILPTGGDVFEGECREGELWVGGVVASGYVDNTLETARKFVPLPGSDDLVLMHRTGDLVALADQGMRVVGRVDRQVKVAGNRINLDSVEATLVSGVDWLDAAHVDLDPESGRARVILVGQPPDPENWRLQLDPLLPSAMRGSEYVLGNGSYNLSGKLEWKVAGVERNGDAAVKAAESHHKSSEANAFVLLVGALPTKQREALERALWADIRRQVLG